MWLLRLLRRLTGLIVFAVALVISAVGGGIFLCMPAQFDAGSIPGMSAPATVMFDRYGIPRIQAATAQDAAAALGWVHARDRLFQMDLMRRGAASGRVAELAGPRAVPLDRTMRVLGLRHQAEAELAALPVATRLMLDAYASGVNAYITAHGRWSALQFAVLGRPEPWSPVDSLLWGKTMGMYLSGNWRSEVSRQALAGRVPQAQIDQLWPPQDGTPPPSAGRRRRQICRAGGLAGCLPAALPRSVHAAGHRLQRMGRRWRP